MAALPYMQLYVAEYLVDTLHLKALQHGAYMLLLMHYWQRGKGLPNDDKRLAIIARMTPKEWKKNRESLAEFFEVTDEGWKHLRVERDLAEVSEKSGNARKAVAAREDKKAKARSTNDERTINHTEQNRTDTEQKKEAPLVFDGSMVAQAVLQSCSLSGASLARTISDVARSEISNGREGLAVMEQMMTAWDEWSAARGSGKLAVTPGAEKFFGEGLWKDKAEWPWRKDASDQQNRTTRVSPAVERHSESRANIRSGFDALRGGRPRNADGADDSAIPQPDAPPGHASDVRGVVGGDGSGVRDGGFPGRTIEGNT
jgi:uncharacterized protein YdaU (DUF1376 family)